MRQFRNIISISSGLVLMLAAGSCTKGPVDPTQQPIRLGSMSIGIVASRPGTADFSFRGRVTSFDTRDTLYFIPGGAYKHFVAMRDTLTNDTLRVYYTLPLNLTFRVDTTLRAVVFFKQVESHFALIIKSKNDSLICMVNSMRPDELDTIFAKVGDQQFRVAVGTELHAWRNSACGREGDFNMLFSSRNATVSVPPGQTADLVDADKFYTLANVQNTQRVKDLANCGFAGTEFSFMIIRR